MAPKEKALEMRDKYLYLKDSKSIQVNTFLFKSEAKECALICVEEILKAVTTIADKKYDYWQEVKQEIEKL